MGNIVSIEIISGYLIILEIEIIGDVKNGELEIIFDELCKQQGIFSAKIMTKLRGD